MPLNLCVIQADRNLNEIVLDKAMLEQQQLQQQSKMNGNKMSKSLSDVNWIQVLNSNFDLPVKSII